MSDLDLGHILVVELAGGLNEEYREIEINWMLSHSRLEFHLKYFYKECETA